MSEGPSYAEAEWLSGWIALTFLEDPNMAIQHFKSHSNTSYDQTSNEENTSLDVQQKGILSQVFDTVKPLVDFENVHQGGGQSALQEAAPEGGL